MTELLDPVPCNGCGSYYGQHIDGCTMTEHATDAMIQYPLGKNAKLDEVMVLVAVAAARDAGAGFDLERLKFHSKRATELWREHTRMEAAKPSTPPDYVQSAVTALECDVATAKSEDTLFAFVRIADLEALLPFAANKPSTPIDERLVERIRQLERLLSKSRIYVDDCFGIADQRLRAEIDKALSNVS